MPSGARKRKAAKKKKENQSNNRSNAASASTHTHGDEELKHGDNKESDVGEVSSPASQDHHNQQNILTEGEEEENLPVLPSAKGFRVDGGEKHLVVEESVVQVGKEFKIEGEPDKNGEMVERDEATRKSYDGGSSGSSSSSSSSSDDEIHVIKNSQAASAIASFGDSMKVADQAIHRAPIKGADDSVVEIIPATDSEKILALGEKVVVHVSSPVESVLRENGEKKLSSLEDKFGTSVASVDAASERKEESIVQSAEIAATISKPEECVTQENDDRLTVTYNAPRATADNGIEHVKDSGITEPLLVPSPRPVQKSSWKSCCGLFEVFSGSGA